MDPLVTIVLVSPALFLLTSTRGAGRAWAAWGTSAATRPAAWVLRSRFWLGGGSGIPAEELRTAIPDEVGLGLMHHANTEFKYLSRFVPSLYVADRREDEPVDLPW